MNTDFSKTQKKHPANPSKEQQKKETAPDEFVRAISEQIEEEYQETFRRLAKGEE